MVFVGPKTSGKTSALCLLHFTVLEYQSSKKFKIDVKSYAPNIITAGHDFFGDADSLVLFGKDVEPTSPEIEDLKIEFQLNFKDFMSERKARIVFADVASPINQSLMKIFPNLPNAIPDEVVENLSATGIKPEFSVTRIGQILGATGIILVVDCTKIGKHGPESPDVMLSNYLVNLLNYIEHDKNNPRGIGLLLTKFDKWDGHSENKPTRDEVEKLVVDKLPNLWGIIQFLNKNKNVRYSTFYSGLEEWDGKEENGNHENATSQHFNVEPDSEGRTRVKYDIEQYAKLILWIKDTFK